MRITSIDRPPRKHHYDVYVDMVLRVPLSAEVLAQAQLRTGQEISDAQLNKLVEAEARHSAMSSALRQLAYRPRSEKEMRETLRRKNVRPDVLEETMTRLRDLRLLDDAEFARSYVDARDRTSPRSRRLMRSELRSHGVPRTALDEPLTEIDEADAAYRAGSKRAGALAKLTYADFQRRLGDHLLRRGFAYETARATVRRLWEEQRGETPAEELD